MNTWLTGVCFVVIGWFMLALSLGAATNDRVQIRTLTVNGAGAPLNTSGRYLLPSAPEGARPLRLQSSTPPSRQAHRQGFARSQARAGDHLRSTRPLRGSGPRTPLEFYPGGELSAPRLPDNQNLAEEWTLVREGIGVAEVRMVEEVEALGANLESDHD